MKAIPTLLIVLPIVLIHAKRPLRPLSIDKLGFGTTTEIGWLVFTSIIVQIFGNVAFQWALQIVGLSVSIPIVLGTMLIGGAVAGKMVLGEPVSRRKVVAMFVLTLATIMLSMGAKNSGVSPTTTLAPSEVSGSAAVVDTSSEAHETPIAESKNAAQVTLALLAVIAAGIAYSIQGTMMRRSLKRGLSVSATLLVISASGIVFLVIWSIMQLGVSGILAVAPMAVGLMLAAGLFNAIAFFSMGKSLQHVSVLYVQLLNASQVAISAVAGWLLFSEQMNSMIGLGLGLTALGLITAGFRDEVTDGSGRSKKDPGSPLTPASNTNPTDINA